jgi:pyrroloquinoline quinone biosynthesis protein B
MIATGLIPLVDAAGEDSGLRCEVQYLGGRYPKFVKSNAADLASNEGSAALFFASAQGKRVAYVPAAGDLSDTLMEKIRGVDLLLFDGTFWSDDEFPRVKGSGETAHEMGHIPVEESLRLLKNVEVGRKMFIHLNNTNPILNEKSIEHRAVLDAGWEVAEDNWQLEL